MADDSDYLSGSMPSDDDQTQTIPHAEDVAPLLQQRIPGLVVTGMARTPAQNKAVNGVSNSAHLSDRALDIRATPGLTLDQLQQHVTALGLPNAKVIYEGPGAANSTGPHFHVQWGSPGATVAPPSSAPVDYLGATVPSDIAPPQHHAGWRANGTNVEWYDPNNPTSTAPAQAAIAKVAPGVAKSALTGLVQGSIGLATMPGEGLDASGNLVASALDFLSPGQKTISDLITGNQPQGAGTKLMHALSFARPIIHSMFPTSEDIGSVVTLPTGGYYQPKTPLEQYSQKAGSFIPSMFGGEATIPQFAGRLLTRVLAPAGASQYAQQAASASENALIRRAAPVIGDVAAIGSGIGGEAAARAPGAAANLVRSLTPGGQDTLATEDALAAIHHFAGGPVPTPNIASGVPGVQRTLAEAAAPGSEAGVSALQNAVQGVEPNSPLHYRAQSNNEARQNFFDKTAGSPEDIERAAKARDVAADVARQNIFNPQSDLGPRTIPPVDLQPVKDTITAIESSPERGRTAITNATKFVSNAIDRVAENGTTDPETAYQSIRKEINDYISGKLNLNDKSQMLAASHLIQIRDSLDNAIEKSAPGFNDYLKSYSDSSGPINAMEFLQKQNVATAQGTITLNKIDTAIKRLEAQQSASGVQQGKSVTGAQKDALEAIRDDLLRQANITRFRTVGSNTVEKFLNQQRLGLAQHIPAVLTGGGIGAAIGETVGSHLGIPGIGGDLGGMAGGAIASKITANPLIRALAQEKLEHFLLNPSDYAKARDAAAARGAGKLLRRANP